MTAVASAFAAACSVSADGLYDAGFYDRIRDGCRSSAAVIAPIVDRLFPGESVLRPMVDVGCGEGWWAQAFADLGWDASGVDGHDLERAPALREPWQYRRADLARPFVTEHMCGAFELAVCLEVAEHLPPERGHSLIGELCELAPVILFSAAVPGQGGIGHINEQWQSYWTAEFVRRGYATNGFLRWRIWSDARVEPWYRQNLLLAVSTVEPTVEPIWAELAQHNVEPENVVHPDIWSIYRPPDPPRRRR